MKRVIGLLLAISVLAGCSTNEVNDTNSEGANVEKMGEAKPQSVGIFNMTWEEFQDSWQQAFLEGDAYLGEIRSFESKPGPFSTHYKVNLANGLFLSVYTDEETETVINATIIGAASTEEQAKNVFVTAAMLVKLADPALPLEKRKEIAFEQLELGHGEISETKNLTYKENGISYIAEYDTADAGTLLVTVQNKYND